MLDYNVHVRTENTASAGDIKRYKMDDTTTNIAVLLLAMRHVRPAEKHVLASPLSLPLTPQPTPRPHPKTPDPLILPKSIFLASPHPFPSQPQPTSYGTFSIFIP